MAHGGGGGGDVIVWEWKNELNVWRPYDSNVSNFIEKCLTNSTSLPGSGGGGNASHPSQFGLGQIESKMKMYSIDFNQMTQIRKGTGTQRPIRREVYNGNHPLAKDVVWEWSGDRHGEWCAYDSKTSEVLEKAFQHPTVVDLQPACSIPYEVDLRTMRQTKKGTGYVRNVRRIQHTNSSYTGVPSTGPVAISSISSAPTAQSNHILAAIHPQPRFTNRSRQTPSAPPLQSSLKSGHTPVSATPSQLEPSIGSGRELNPSLKDLDVGVIVTNFTHAISNPPQNEECAICLEELTQTSGFDSTDKNILQLSKCKHMYHHACLLKLLSDGNKCQSLQCPTCKTIHGVKHGDCPPGELEYCTLPQSVAGYSDCGTISIKYSIQSGIQGPEHPNPGHHFSTVGFPRTGYLPDNDQGRKVFRLLKTAWQRRLTFTIGTSVTSNRGDTVIWNEIHHKTELNTNQGHGFPDPKYLDNIMAELAAHGVTDA